jgi:hypothetical protein
MLLLAVEGESDAGCWRNGLLDKWMGGFVVLVCGAWGGAERWLARRVKVSRTRSKPVKPKKQEDRRIEDGLGYRRAFGPEPRFSHS